MAIFTEIGDRLGTGISAIGLGTWQRERGNPERGPAAVHERDA